MLQTTFGNTKQGEKMLEKELLKKKVWAVVGATQNTKKYGYLIYKKLKAKGYEAYAINPVYETIEDDKCYKDLSSLPTKPEAINMVVSPKRAKGIVDEAAKLGIKYIWFQPDTYNDEVLAYTKEKGIEYVLACILVATSLYVRGKKKE